MIDHEQPSHGIGHDVDMSDILTVIFVPEINKSVEFVDHGRLFDTLYVSRKNRRLVAYELVEFKK